MSVDISPNRPPISSCTAIAPAGSGSPVGISTPSRSNRSITMTLLWFVLHGTCGRRGRPGRPVRVRPTTVTFRLPAPYLRLRRIPTPQTAPSKLDQRADPGAPSPTTPSDPRAGTAHLDLLLLHNSLAALPGHRERHPGGARQLVAHPRAPVS